MAIEKNIIIGADLSGLEKKLDELIEALKDSQKQADKTADSINDIADSTKGISKNAEEGKKGIKSLSGGFKGLGLAIKGAGIGILLSALSYMKELFDNNQKVVDFFNTTFNTLQVAFSDFTKWISGSGGSKIVDYFKNIFENPKQAVADLGQAIKDNIIERFNSLMEVLGFVGSALKKFFAGDFKGALADVKEAGLEMVDVYTGVDGTVEKVVNGTKKLTGAVTEYVKGAVKQGQAMTKLNKQAELASVLNQGLLEKYDRQAERLRQIRDDETLTIEERKKANEELGKVLDEQEKTMLANAQIALDQANQQLKLAPDNIEFIKARMEAENELAAIEAQIDGFRSEYKTNQNALDREAIDLLISRAENEQEVAEIEAQALIDAESNVFKQLELEEQLNKKLYDDRLAALEQQKSFYKEGTQAYQDMVNEINILNAERTAQEEEEGRKRRELEQGVQQARLQMTGDAIGALNDLAQAFLGSNEKNARKAFQINKALGISQAVVNTAQAVTAALTAGGNPIKLATGAQFVEAGIAAAAGAAQIATIASQQFNAGGSSGGSYDSNVPQPSQMTATPRTPNFNVVGQSGTNALLESLQSKPMKAYVVGGDVTTQQQLDRRKVTTASFG